MKQIKPCPKCGKKAGWHQYMPGYAIQHKANGMIAFQHHHGTDKETKRCIECGIDITELVKGQDE